MPEEFVKPFFAFCPECKQLVTTFPRFTRAEATEALRSGADLKVMHTEDRDHVWTLSKKERERLSRRMGSGEV